MMPFFKSMREHLAALTQLSAQGLKGYGKQFLPRDFLERKPDYCPVEHVTIKQCYKISFSNLSLL